MKMQFFLNLIAWLIRNKLVSPHRNEILKKLPNHLVYQLGR